MDKDQRIALLNCVCRHTDFSVKRLIPDAEIIDDLIGKGESGNEMAVVFLAEWYNEMQGRRTADSELLIRLRKFFTLN